MPKKHHQQPVAAIAQPIPEAQPEAYNPSTLVFLLNWLASAILFFLLANVLLPYVLNLQQGYDAQLGITLNNWLFGLGGLLIYFAEPLVHYSFSARFKNPEKTVPEPWPASLLGSLAKYIGLFALGMPYAILKWVRPVIRALILFQSFTLLHLGGGESPLFVVVVMSDLFLYYANIVFPDWKHSPNKMIAQSAFFKLPVVYWMGSFLSIIYTAIICSGFAYGAYQQAGQSTLKGEDIIVLLFFWYLSMIYVRMDFLENHIDNLTTYFKRMPLRNVLLNIFILLISLVGFLWKWFWDKF